MSHIIFTSTDLEWRGEGMLSFKFQLAYPNSLESLFIHLESKYFMQKWLIFF